MNASTRGFLLVLVSCTLTKGSLRSLFYHVLASPLLFGAAGSIQSCQICHSRCLSCIHACPPSVALRVSCFLWAGVSISRNKHVQPIVICLLLRRPLGNVGLVLDTSVLLARVDLSRTFHCAFPYQTRRGLEVFAAHLAHPSSNYPLNPQHCNINLDRVPEPALEIELPRSAAGWLLNCLTI